MEIRSLEELRSLYIGKKIEGFRFKSLSNISFIDDMNAFIGHVGEIKEIKLNSIIMCKVRFTTPHYKEWWYPMDYIEDNLYLGDIDLKDLFNKIKSI